MMVFSYKRSFDAKDWVGLGFFIVNSGGLIPDFLSDE